MADRFRVVQKDALDGTATYYVVDAEGGDKPSAEFDDRETAENKASELNAADAASPAPPEADAGPINP